MQRCRSGRSCSLGTAVYRNVPWVQIPVSAPKKIRTRLCSFLFAEWDLQTFVCQQFHCWNPFGSRVPVLLCNPPDKYAYRILTNPRTLTPTRTMLSPKIKRFIF